MNRLNEKQRKEREARSAALEKAYVHDVYEQISPYFQDTRYRAWPKVKDFIMDLEPGSLVCDVGCGNGKYLNINPSVYNIGADRCSSLAEIAREKEHEVVICDNLCLPYREETFDAALSVAVIHHFATTERRVIALRELARVLKIGGRIMITVWAKEQRHRKFESQDVLVPWHRPQPSSSEEKVSSIDKDPGSTTTSEDDILNYHAYTQSDSDSCQSNRLNDRHKVRHRSQSIDPAMPSSSQSSSDLSSPNETCYSFVRRALQVKLSATRGIPNPHRPWFMHSLSSFDAAYYKDNILDPITSLSVEKQDSLDSNDNLEDTMIEIHHLEDAEDNYDIELALNGPKKLQKSKTIDETSNDLNFPLYQKSKSASDLLNALALSSKYIKGLKSDVLITELEDSEEKEKMNLIKSLSVTNGIHTTLTNHMSDKDDDHQSNFTPEQSKLAQQSCSEKEDRPVTNNTSETNKEPTSDAQNINEYSTPAAKEVSFNIDESLLAKGSDGPNTTPKRGVNSSNRGEQKRPCLVKQKQSIYEDVPHPCDLSPDSHMPETEEVIKMHPNLTSQRYSLPTIGEMKEKREQMERRRSFAFKQTSLNDELLTERTMECEKIRQKIQKQTSLNENLIYSAKNPEKEESILLANFKKLQIVKNGLKILRSPSTDKSEVKETVQNTLRNGLVRILQSWRSEPASANEPKLVTPDTKNQSKRSSMGILSNFKVFETKQEVNSDDDKKSNSMFTFPNILNRSQMNYKNLVLNENGTKDNLKSPYLYENCIESPTLKEVSPVENMEFEFQRTYSTGRKGSKDENSDSSSKENSFQSDTSMDSEDSFVSVIYIPKGEKDDFKSEVRKDLCTSLSSESDPSSPKSPKSPKSPGSTPNYRYSNGKICPKPVTNGFNPFRRKSPPFDNSLPIRNKVWTKWTEGGEAIKTTESSDTVQNTNKARLRGSISLTDNCIPEEEVSTPNPSPTSNNLKPNDTPNVVTITPAGTSQPAKLVKSESLPTKTNFPTSQLSSLLLGENIEIIRKPITPGARNVQVVRKCVPKLLTFEVFNPEIDDLDSDTSLSSSPNSPSSVISVINEERWPSKVVDTTRGTEPEEERCELEVSTSTQAEMEALLPNELDNKNESSGKKPSRRESSCDGSETDSSVSSTTSNRKEKLLGVLSRQKKSRELSHLSDSLSSIDEAVRELCEMMSPNDTIQFGDSFGENETSKHQINEYKTVSKGPEFCSDASIKFSPKSRRKHKPSALTDPKFLKTLEDLEEVDTPIIKQEFDDFPTLITQHSIATRDGEKNGLYSKFSTRFCEHLLLEVWSALHIYYQLPLLAMRLQNRSDENKTKQLGSKTPSTVSLWSSSSSSVLPETDSFESSLSWTLSSRYSSSSSQKLSSFSTSSNFSSVSLSDFEERTKSDSLPDLWQTRKDSVLEAAIRPELAQILDPPKDGTGKRLSWDRQRIDSREGSLIKRLLPRKKNSLPVFRPKHSLTNVSEYPIFIESDSKLSSSTEKISEKSGSQDSDSNKIFGDFSGGLRAKQRESSLSISSSQDSLESDTGGELSYHRYYHVFKQGELDHLIEKYVENLHIISSYYDHANWCIIAEKVRVWTI